MRRKEFFLFSFFEVQRKIFFLYTISFCDDFFVKMKNKIKWNPEQPQATNWFIRIDDDVDDQRKSHVTFDTIDNNNTFFFFFFCIEYIERPSAWTNSRNRLAQSRPFNITKFLVLLFLLDLKPFLRAFKHIHQLKQAKKKLLLMFSFSASSERSVSVMCVRWVYAASVAFQFAFISVCFCVLMPHKSPTNWQLFIWKFYGIETISV